MFLMTRKKKKIYFIKREAFTKIGNDLMKLLKQTKRISI